MSDRNLPPPNRVPRNLDAPLAQIVDYTVADWCPARDGKGPAEAVALHLRLRLGNDLLELAMRLRTPGAVDTMIAALRRHRDSVWPGHKE